MNLVDVFTKIPTTISDDEKLKMILRRYFFIKDNKWMKESEIITRYKRLPPLADSFGGNYTKTIANMVHDTVDYLIETNHVNANLVTIAKQRGTFNYRVNFDRMDRQTTELRGILEANPQWYVWNRWGLDYQQNNSFTIRYHSLGNLAGLGHVELRDLKTLEQFKNEVGPIFTVLGNMFPAPVVETPAVVATPEAIVPEIEL